MFSPLSGFHNILARFYSSFKKLRTSCDVKRRVISTMFGLVHITERKRKGEREREDETFL